MECIQDEQEQRHVPMISRQDCTFGDRKVTDFVAGPSLKSVVDSYEKWPMRVQLSLHTHPVVRRELVRDEAVQESVDCPQRVSTVNNTNYH